MHNKATKAAKVLDRKSLFLAFAALLLNFVFAFSATPHPFAAWLCPFLLVGPRIGLILFMIARWFRSFPYASHNLDSG